MKLNYSRILSRLKKKPPGGFNFISMLTLCYLFVIQGFKVFLASLSYSVKMCCLQKINIEFGSINLKNSNHNERFGFNKKFSANFNLQ